MKRITNTVLTNMCMVCDGDNILVQDKVNSSYTGVTFPGGHIEEGEALRDSIIREIKEETAISYLNELDKKYSPGTEIINGAFNPKN